MAARFCPKVECLDSVNGVLSLHFLGNLSVDAGTSFFRQLYSITFLYVYVTFVFRSFRQRCHAAECQRCLPKYVVFTNW